MRGVESELGAEFGDCVTTQPQSVQLLTTLKMQIISGS